ncbi:MAG: DUF1415 domain-containing protein [Gammaproteobacteria bacterium]|nr:DUF1415 domain-containing protein [Gammaproteobacteria bacterium]
MSDQPHGDDAVLRATRDWLERFVIGLGLCPFAAAPFNGGRIRFAVTHADAIDDIYQDFLSLLYDMFTCEPGDVETALLVLSRGLPAFDDYLDALALLDQVIVEAGAEGLVQVASFHPDYRFDGAPVDDPANYSNRSPFPMFHLIREDGLSAALESIDDPGAIPARNVARLRALGVAGIRELVGSSEPPSGE